MKYRCWHAFRTVHPCRYAKDPSGDRRGDISEWPEIQFVSLRTYGDQLIIMTYFVYITTNPGRTTLYTGMTNNLALRMEQHKSEREKQRTFAGRYYCYNLIYYECFHFPYDAITREKEIKKWSRTKKEQLIGEVNPNWDFIEFTSDPYLPGFQRQIRGLRE